MLRSCLVLLVSLVIAWFVEKHYIDALALPYSSWLAAAGAVEVALAVGAIEATIAMHFRKPAHQYSGILRAAGPPVTSPLSGRTVLAYRFKLSMQNSDDSTRLLSGIGMAPCEIVTPAGNIALDGMPWLDHFNEESLAFNAADIPRLAALPWRGTGEINLRNWNQHEISFGTSGGSLLFAGIPDPTAETVASLLRGNQWSAEETIIPIGTTVTATGTFSTPPPRLAIARGFTNLHHELRPGTAAAVTKQNLTRQWIGMIVFVSFCVISHVILFAFSDQILVWLRSL